MMRLERLKIEDITVEDRYREDYGDVEALAESLEERGLIQPISVDQQHRLIAGGRRLRAATLLEWETIPVVIHDVQGEADRLRIELYENIHRKDLRWDERARLEKRLFDIESEHNPVWSLRKQGAHQGVSKDTVHRRIQLAEALEMLPDLAEHETEDGAWKEYKKLEEDYAEQVLVKKVKADPQFNEAVNYAEEHYRIGDALTAMKEANKATADFAEVDPPYAVDLNTLREGRNKDKSAQERYNEISEKDYVAFLSKAAKQVYRILKPNSYCIWWHGSRWYTEVLAVLEGAGFKVNPVPALWYKGNVGQASQPDVALASCYEPFFVARKGKPKLHKPGRVNVFHFNPLAPQKKIHATERPMALMDDLIDTFCFPGSTLLVPFLGSGVTLRSAYKAGHSGWGYDMHEENRDAFLQKILEDKGAI